MTAIFKKGTCLRRDLFDTFVSVFTEAGWEILEDEGKDKDYRVVLHSSGSLGNTNLYLALYYYAGTDRLGTPSYNIKTSNSVDGLFKWIKDWDYEKKEEKSIYGNWNRLSFFHRNGNVTASGELTLTDKLPMEYYYYADLDRIIFITISDKIILEQDKPGYSNYPTVNFFGIPQETYVEEKLQPSYSCAIHASTSTSYTGLNYSFFTCNKPRKLLDKHGYENSFNYFVCYPSPGDGGAANGPIIFWDLYITEPDVGLRAKLGFLQCFRPNSKVITDGRSGDTIEVETEEGIEVYFPFYTNYANWSSNSGYVVNSSFGGGSISYLAIRIE